MKGKLSPVYYVIPVLYIAVILFFIFMQLQARESFQAEVGNLSVSGMHTRTLAGGQSLKQVVVRFHGLRFKFNRSSGLSASFGAIREKKISAVSYSQFPDGFEIEFEDGIALRLVLEGALGDRVVIRAIIPENLQGASSISLPFDVAEGEQRIVTGVPLLEARGAAGTVFLSLPAGSEINADRGRLVLHPGGTGAGVAVVLERVLEQQEPYLYWFSQGLPMVGPEQFDSQVSRYLNKAYQYWNGVFVANPGDRRLAGDLGISLISEAIKRGNYRTVLSVIARNIRQFLRDNADNLSLYRSAAFLGNLPSFLSTRQSSAGAEIDRLTTLIKNADPSLFETPDLIRFILNHAPFSLVEEVLRLADSLQLEQLPVRTLIHLAQLYVNAAEYLETGDTSSSRLVQIINGHILPSIRKTAAGLFLKAAAYPATDEMSLYESLLAGRTLVQAGVTLANESYSTLGRNLIYSTLILSDPQAFIPLRLRVRDQRIEPSGELIAPEEIYPLIPVSRYIPLEYPLYKYLYPGSWIWTASVPSEIKIDESQYRFLFSFPTGETHYLLIQGIRPMQSIILHGTPWKPDPEYFRYTDGWVYDSDTQTLYVKLTHRSDGEELVISY